MKIERVLFWLTLGAGFSICQTLRAAGVRCALLGAGFRLLRRRVAAVIGRVPTALAFVWVVVLILLAAAFNFAWWAIYTPAEFFADCAAIAGRKTGV